LKRLLRLAGPEQLKSIDKIAGRVAIHLLPPPKHRETTRDINSILLIRPGGIGDAVLLAPTILALTRYFPSAKIHVLAERRNCGIFELIPGIDKTFLYDTPSGLFESLRARYDLVIDTEQWHRLSALIARLTNAPIIIGFDTNDRRRMFTDLLPYCHDDYEADSFLHLLSPLFSVQKFDINPPFLFPPPKTFQTAAELLAPLKNYPIVTIFPGASINERKWGSERFAEVLNGLESRGIRGVIVGSNEDVEHGEAIITGTRSINLAGKTSLAVTAAIISSTRLLLSGDSGVLHIGVGVGASTVSLFGPGIVSKWAPRGDRHTVLNMNLDCSPCTRFGTTPRCKRGVPCLSSIEVEMVIESVMKHLPTSTDKNI